MSVFDGNWSVVMPGHGDDVPLQPLGGVPGEQLDRLRVDRDLARLQAALALLGVAQVAEEGRQRRQLGQLGELGGDPVQRVEVGPGAGRARARGAGQLGLQAQGAGDLVDQVGQRLARAGCAGGRAPPPSRRSRR